MTAMSCRIIFVVSALCLFLQGCAEVTAPDARNVNIPSPVTADKRKDAVNERPDSVMYLPLGEDILVPERMTGQDLPKDNVGPFELRAETLAGALQLILADYDISIAFETDAGLDREVTVANLKGPLNKVVQRVCSLADLYCSYEDGAIVVKDTQTFTVTLPPLADADGGTEFIDDVIDGLTAIIGESGTAPVSDATTRTLIYSATQRTSSLAANYFQRLRANTAMIVFETYIWEVSLDSGNSTGIDWSSFDTFGKFNTSIGVNGAIGANFTNPISIGLPTTSAIGANPTQLVEFLSTFGAVKTISQPQVTVLSGSEAELRVADTQNYVSEVTSTVSGDQTTTSVSTDSVDSGFTLNVGSSWDKSTIYANVAVNLTNVDQIENFAFDTDAGGGQTTIQLPQTSERELTTQIRVRPGDSVLIGGLVRETDNFDSRGPGFMEPIIPDSRTATTSNLELVILLRPRVVVYTEQQDEKFQNYLKQKAIELRSSKARPEWMKSSVTPRQEIQDKKIVSPDTKPAPTPAPSVSAAPLQKTPSSPPPPVEKVMEIKEEAPVQAPVVSPAPIPPAPKVVAPPVKEEPPVIREEPVLLVPEEKVDMEPVVKEIVPEPVVIEKPVIEVKEPVRVSTPVPSVPEEIIIVEPEPVAVKAPMPSTRQLTSPEPYIPRTSSGYETGYVSKYKPVKKEASKKIEEVIKEVSEDIETVSEEIVPRAPEVVETPTPPTEPSLYENFEAGQHLFSE